MLFVQPSVWPKPAPRGVLMTDLDEIGLKGSLSIQEAKQRFKAAKEGLKGTDCILVARTEYQPSEGLAAACDRCNHYMDMGADMTLIHYGINPYDGDKTDMCEFVAKRVPGWKWFPDLNADDKVDLKEIAKYGFVFTGVHYLQTSAMEAMLELRYAMCIAVRIMCTLDKNRIAPR